MSVAVSTKRKQQCRKEEVRDEEDQCSECGFTAYTHDQQCSCANLPVMVTLPRLLSEQIKTVEKRIENQERVIALLRERSTSTKRKSHIRKLHIKIAEDREALERLIDGRFSARMSEIHKEIKNK